jgi:hypothetical protein
VRGHRKVWHVEAQRQHQRRNDDTPKVTPWAARTRPVRRWAAVPATAVIPTIRSGRSLPRAAIGSAGRPKRNGQDRAAAAEGTERNPDQQPYPDGDQQHADRRSYHGRTRSIS